MEIRKVPISEVETWDKNPRNITVKDFERLKRQIKELGVYKPLICVQENGKYITLGGNMRLSALAVLKLKEVDISLVKAPDEATKIKYALSDNDRAGSYNEQALAELTYPHLEEINLDDFKIDVGQPISLKDLIEDYAPDIDGEDEVPELDDSPAITKMGDLFQLGKHRLLCGDATKEEDVKRLMGGEKADMVFTDPPYGIDLDTDYSIDYKNRRGNIYEKVKNDNKSFNAEFIFNFFGKTDEMFLFGANYYADTIPNLNKTSWFVWDKRLPSNQDVGFASQFELIISKQKHKQEIINFEWFRFFGLKDEDIKKRIHPTQKPEKLCRWFINKFSKENQNIWDGFLGSGTTLIACEKLNRICYGMEICEKYCDVIVTRYSNFTDIPEEEIRATKRTDG